MLISDIPNISKEFNYKQTSMVDIFFNDLRLKCLINTGESFVSFIALLSGTLAPEHASRAHPDCGVHLISSAINCRTSIGVPMRRAVSTTSPVLGLLGPEQAFVFA